VPAFGTLGPDPDTYGVLELRGSKPVAERLPPDLPGTWNNLDVALLHVLLIDPLLREANVTREDALRYTRDAREAFAAVRSGEARLAFFLNPTPVQQVLDVADASERMPEKSTFFLPKPPTGLVIRDLSVG
jgi:uncharacterized protein (DUF1015 family)